MSRNHWQRLREEEESFEFIVIKEPGIYKGVLCDPEIAEVRVTGYNKYSKIVGWDKKPVWLLRVNETKYFVFTDYLASDINELHVTSPYNDHKYFNGHIVEVEVINKTVRDWRFYDITLLRINSIKVMMQYPSPYE